MLTAYETGGLPQLSLLDADGERALTLGVSESGVACLEIPGDQGPARRPFAVGAEGQPTLREAPRPASCRGAGARSLSVRGAQGIRPARR